MKKKTKSFCTHHAADDVKYSDLVLECGVDVFHMVAFFSAGEPIPTRKLLMKELYSTVASKWRPIGIFLEIPDGELNTIAEREQGDPQKCLMAMLGVWLHRTSPPASWSDIAEAVEVVGMSDIAQQIRQKYCKLCMASPLAKSTITSKSLQEQHCTVLEADISLVKAIPFHL